MLAETSDPQGILVVPDLYFGLVVICIIVWRLAIPGVFPEDPTH